jgi:hypothetical protein
MQQVDHPALWRRLRMLLGSATVALGLSFGCVLFLGQIFLHPSAQNIGVRLLLVPAAFVGPFVFMIVALYLSFRQREEPRLQLWSIITSYLCMTIVFASIYLLFAYFDDRVYAVDHYRYYESLAEAPKDSGRLVPFSETAPGRSTRAFAGIENHVWSTLDDRLARPVLFNEADPERYRARMTRIFSFEEAVRLERRNVLLVFADCLHLSIMTFTTVGYGNIAPTAWYARLISVSNSHH